MPAAAPAPAAAAAPAPAAAAPPAPPPGRTVDFTTQGSGAFLALFIYPLALNFLRGGQAQAWGWVKAKWINQPYGAAAPAPKQANSSSTTLPPNDMRRVVQQ
jgi:hypothetical protein